MTQPTVRIRDRHRPRRAAFSLVEVLLAIFILAIGIISIAALFPAGIAQQRLSNDDFMGPIVANHAMSVIRSKISADDFGSFEEFARVGEFNEIAPQAYFSRTIPGDWGWMRPSVIWPTDAVDRADLEGAIDIFSHWRVRQDYLGSPSFLSFVTTSEFYDPVNGWDGWPEETVWNAIGDPTSDPPLHGLPFNLDKHFFALHPVDRTYPPLPPRRIISQGERYYPMQSSLVEADRSRKPEYVWDCMFRRFQGRVYVAIFVYRVSTPQTGDVLYRTPPNPIDEQLPYLPFALDLRDANASGAVWNPASGVWYDALTNLRGPWDVHYDEVAPGVYRPSAFVEGTRPGTELNVVDPRQAWQESRQWIIDQNNNVYRVLGQSRENFNADPMKVELSRPLMPVPIAAQGAATVHPSDAVNPPPAQYGTPFNDVPLPTENPYEFYGNHMEFPPTGFANDGVAFPDATLLPQPFFNNATSFDRGVVTDLYYMPIEVEDADGNAIRITPVYATVKEL